jgi:hypothetical protein
LLSLVSLLALFNKSVAITFKLAASSASFSFLLFGILAKRLGKRGPTSKESLIGREGLIALKESKAVMTEDVCPLRVPKSCKNPALPMLSNLGRYWE